MQEIPGYRIEGEAGRGGWSVVYRAVQLSLNRPVALKVIAPELASDDGFRARFRRECEIAAALDHPHVIPVYDAGEAGGALYVAMRWVDGPNLRVLAPLEPHRAARIVAQVGGALDAAHARGLVHRDVKPGNVLVEQRPGGEHAYLTDFGLTKEISSDPGLTDAGRWLGTVDFASPEQIRGRAPDARSDVYSLGCVLGFALTGMVPFPRPSPRATMQAHMHDPVPALPYPLAPFDPVLARALHKRPDLRFASAGELGAAAEAVAAGALPAAAAGTAAAPSSGGTDTAIARVLAGVFGIAVLFVAIIVALASGGGGGGGGGTTSGPAQPSESVTLLPLRDGGETGMADIGVGILGEEQRGVELRVRAQLDAPDDDEVFEIWLYDSRSQVRSLGILEEGPSVNDPDEEEWSGGDVLPTSWRDYRWVDVSIEEAENDDGLHSGRSVLRGDLSNVEGPPE